MAIVLDIECTSQEWDSLPESHRLMARKELSKQTIGQRVTEEEAKERLALSPYTGTITVVSLWDTYFERGVTYYVHPYALEGLTEKGDQPVLYRHCKTEKELLERVWRVLGRISFKQVVTFNGRGFDLPYLMVRSICNGVPVLFDLVNAKRYESNHIDVSDVISVYGSCRFNVSLEMLCEQMGIESPKTTVSGKDAPVLWKQGPEQKKEVVLYCGRDTASLGAVAVGLDNLGVIDLWSDRRQREEAEKAAADAEKAAATGAAPNPTVTARLDSPEE